VRKGRGFDRGQRPGVGGGPHGIPRWSTSGESHRGRGPRDDQRPDARIREDVCDHLTDDDEVDAREISVSVESGEVTLEGTVDERRIKWLAEEIAVRCLGVVDVHNRLRVRKTRPSERRANAESPSSSSRTPRDGHR
jgi:BON domain